MMRTTVGTQPQIIIVACCITLRRSAYDTAGNIRSITKDGTVTKSFGYTNPSWPDLLTSVTSGSTTKDILYEGQTQTSDLPSSGNPITYYNGRDYHFDWSKGRQLTEAVVGGQTVEYTYDMSGVRTSKTVNGTTYNYTTLSGKVMRQTWGKKSLEFVYDDGNQPFAMIYNDGSTSTLYYYVLNAQGDVIALLDSAGALVASYNYGAWGNYSVHDDKGVKNTSASFIGHINPLRYRGYYYDRETRLYYLQSRYYDFANCRFINADTFATTDANGFLSANMFAYCENNPIMGIDPTGELTASIVGMAVGAGVGALVSGLSQIASNVINGEAWNKDLGLSVLTGAASGLTTAISMNPAARVAVNAAISFAGSLYSEITDKSKTGIRWDKVACDTIIGGVTGAKSGIGNGTIKYLARYERSAIRSLGSGSFKLVRNSAKYSYRHIKSLIKIKYLRPFWRDLGKNAAYSTATGKIWG